MNIPLFAAAILTLIGAIVHAIGGEKTDIKHLLHSEIPTSLKVELRMSWYLVAIDMAVSGIYMLLVVTGTLPEDGPLLGFIALRFVLYGACALMLLLLTQRDYLFKVPQWVLLMAIGLAIWLGM